MFAADLSQVEGVTKKVNHFFRKGKQVSLAASHPVQGPWGILHGLPQVIPKRAYCPSRLWRVTRRPLAGLFRLVGGLLPTSHQSPAIGAPLRGGRRAFCAPTYSRGPDPVGTAF